MSSQTASAPPQQSICSRLLHTAAFVPLTALLPSLYLVTSRTPKIKPFYWVYGIVLIVFIIHALWTRRIPKRVDAVLAASFGLAATHLLLKPGFPQGHDIVTHMWGLYSFCQAILHGDYLPHWLHHLGLGMPFLLFYPPLPFYASLPFLAANVPSYDILKYTFIVFNILSALSMRWVMERWTGHRLAALVAAGAYAFAPYHLLESHFRIAFAEAAAFAVLPFYFYTVRNALREPSRKPVALAALSIAGLAMTHPLSLSMAATATVIWVLFDRGIGPMRSVPKTLGLLLGLGLLGFGLAGYYTLPAAAEAHYVTIASATGSRHPTYAKHGLRPYQLMERRAWHTWQKSEARGSKNERSEMPFYFGLSLLALLPLGGYRSDPGLVRALKAVSLAALALTLYPLDIALAHFPPMKILQFPWRFLEPATFGASALAGFALIRLSEHKPPWAGKIIAVGVFALLLFDFSPYGGAPSWVNPYEGLYRLSKAGRLPDPMPFRLDGISFPPSNPRTEVSLFRRVYPEYFTPAVRKNYYRRPSKGDLEYIAIDLSTKVRRGRLTKLHPKPYAEFFPRGTKHSVGLEFKRGGGHIEIDLPGTGGILIIKEQFFPGWRATIGRIRPIVEATEDGLMKLELEEGDQGTLSLDFSMTRWDRTGGILLSFLTALFLARPARNRSRPAPESHDESD